MQNKYSVNDIVRIVLKNVIIIVIFAIMGGITFGGIAKYKSRTNTYSSERNILIAHDLSDTSGSNRASLQSTDFKSMQTYITLFKDRDFTTHAYKLLSPNIRKEYSITELQNLVSFLNTPDSLVVKVTVETDSANKSAAISNAFSRAIKKELPKIVPDVGNVNLLSKAKQSEATLKPGPSLKKYLILGIALGTLIGMVISFCLTTWKKILN